MKDTPVKEHPTIACCGLDCGLCPTYYTKGPSRCPGCCGPGFSEKHPSCSIITCCVKKKKYETCADCQDFPCSKLDKWDLSDSFISHKVSLSNLRTIKKDGINKFAEQQKRRIKLLEELLDNYNEGRSKSFYCIAMALLPIHEIEKAINITKKIIEKQNIDENEIKTKSKILKSNLKDLAKNRGIELKLRRS